MPRYFFHIQDGQDIPDDLGALLRDLCARFWPDADWQMHVTDSQGGTIYDLRLSGTVRAPYRADELHGTALPGSVLVKPRSPRSHAARAGGGGDSRLGSRQAPRAGPSRGP